MGYPMTYSRVTGRNRLRGEYVLYADDPIKGAIGLISGDLRRLESDQRDDRHLAEYAKRTGVTEAQALHILDLFFEGDF